MDKIDDGGPAFPSDSDTEGSIGMSLRDYFAAQALPGVQAAIVELAKTGQAKAELSSSPIAAKAAYEIADAMIAARKVQ